MFSLLVGRRGVPVAHEELSLQAVVALQALGVVCQQLRHVLLAVHPRETRPLLFRERIFIELMTSDRKLKSGVFRQKHAFTSEEGTTLKFFRTFTRKPRPDSGLDWRMCDIFDTRKRREPATHDTARRVRTETRQA